MNTLRTWLLVLAVAATIVPASVAAQVQPATVPAAGAAARHRHNLMMQAMAGVDLSDQQKAQIQQLMAQYRQAHPAGSPRDRNARKQLHQQILAVLTPAQQAQFKANIARLRQERRAAMPLPQATATP